MERLATIDFILSLLFVNIKRINHRIAMRILLYCKIIINTHCHEVERSKDITRSPYECELLKWSDILVTVTRVQKGNEERQWIYLPNLSESGTVTILGTM